MQGKIQGMSTFDDPFDSDRPLSLTGCACGQHRSKAEHDHATLALRCEPVTGQETGEATSEEKRYEGVVASAVMRAMFPQDAARRAFLKSVGASTALAAISQFFPLRAATEAFADAGTPEKKDLKVGFIPITCAAPMPIAISLGLGAQAIPFTVPAIENINGQGITLATKHKDKRDPKDWKGMKFAIPFDYSMHNYLLRYYLAEHGLDPDTDVQLRSVPPPEMVANLRADNIDGFLAPDNICQRAIYDGVGFMHLLSKEIWDGHPCCSFAASREFITGSPNSFVALTRAILDATAYASKAENRKQIAEAIAPANYINAPVTVLEQVLTGTYADGLGAIKTDPKRVDFDPFPWQSFAVWMLTQMKRWGQIKGDVDYKAIAEQVYLTTDTRRAMTEMGLAPPAVAYKSFAVMGKTFDPARPEDYLNSFKIRKSS